MSTYRVAVLRGGPSEEYEVSLRTGESVLRALSPNKYTPIDIIISRNGEWIVDGITRVPEQILESIDVVFNALHGSYGEDGTVQRLLDRLSVPYTGSGAFASNVAMDKVRTKEIAKEIGLLTPKSLKINNDTTKVDQLIHSIEHLFGPTYVVKPISGGSSVDTYICTGLSELLFVTKEQLSLRDAVLIEEYIDGREATVGVINNFRSQATYALPTIEIVPANNAKLFSYTGKYDGSTEEICPARFTSNQKQALEQAAIAIHNALNLSQYSRSDFILRGDDIYFLETNTLPGLTTESLLPKSLEAVGCNYNEFVEHLLTDARSQ